LSRFQAAPVSSHRLQAVVIDFFTISQEAGGEKWAWRLELAVDWGLLELIRMAQTRLMERGDL
jgi:hypothetical protein